MKVFLASLLFLSSFELSSCVKCTTDGTNPCMCVLSDGAEGIVDISPLFKDGFLTVNDTK